MHIVWKGPGIYGIKLKSKTALAQLWSSEATESELDNIQKSHSFEGMEFFLLKEKPVAGDKKGTQEVRIVSE